MLFALFGLALLIAVVVGLLRGVPAWQQKRYDTAFSWIVGLPMLALLGCFTIAVIMFVNTDMSY